MKKIINCIALPVILPVLMLGCAPVGDSLAPIGKNDLDEADYMRRVLANDLDAKGNYEVIPGSDVTTVKIMKPNTPLDERSLRLSMRSIKAAMRDSFDREPNKLRFEFRDVTIEE
ncbi:hypothetical protein JIN85_20820 [Luteolibacter pohnpeiensis]|uniref:Uncharacterized protein n=1 Tax=Luteolibacter pohnpeiensis TaxID=454153 RepID=A0A934SC80_9BACT|nr:hypothetical protein [Luteolibacter pohnpeiensis]MBK1884866.1 hypothetical protein [Luteolibacter pohnpeiensis]